MQYYDVYDWPKKFLEDSLMSENNELENIFVDDYIKKIQETNFSEDSKREFLTILQGAYDELESQNKYKINQTEEE